MYKIKVKLEGSSFLLMYQFIRQILSIYYVSDTLLGAKDKGVIKTYQCLPSWSSYCSGEDG